MPFSNEDRRKAADRVVMASHLLTNKDLSSLRSYLDSRGSHGMEQKLLRGLYIVIDLLPDGRVRPEVRAIVAQALFSLGAYAQTISSCELTEGKGNLEDTTTEARLRLWQNMLPKEAKGGTS